jgi:arginyl-tRNA synthetase
VTPGELDNAVLAAAAVALAALGADPAGAAGRAGVRRPRHPEQGDYASPVALRLAKATGLPASDLAGVIAAELGRHPGVRQAEAAGPGFVSIWLTAQASGDLAGIIIADGRAYGHSDLLAGKRFQLVPASDDPPLPALQPDDLSPDGPPFTPLLAGDPSPGGRLLTAALSYARHAALSAAAGRLLLAAGAELSGAAGPGVTSLRIPGPAATRTSAPGPPLIGPSIAPDPQDTGTAQTASRSGPSTAGRSVAHEAQGTSSAGASAPSLMPGTLGHLVAAIGAGTAWYALVSWPPGVPVEIDLAVWARRTSASPAWMVRHARQRIAGWGGRVTAVGISLESGFDPGRLTAGEETALLSLLAEFPAMVAVAGRAGEPHRVARYLESVAAAWSACDEACPVLPRRGRPEPDLARARLTLAEAAGTVLANGLSLLGVPD